MEHVDQLGAVERRDAAVDRRLVREQVVVDGAPALLDAIGQHTADRVPVGRRIEIRIDGLLEGEEPRELRDDALGVGPVALRHVGADLVGAPLVLAAVADRERAVALAEVRADHERHVARELAELGLEVLAVAHWPPFEVPATRAEFLLCLLQRGVCGLEQVAIGQRLDRGHLRSTEAEVLERQFGDAPRLVDREVAGAAAALGDAAVEQALGRRHVHHVHDLARAARLAEDRHVAWIAAEGLDVGLHPPEGRLDVGHARVAVGHDVRAVRREVQRPEHVEPVVERHDDDVAEPAEVLAVVGHALDRRPIGEAAAVQEDHHRTLDARRDVLGPEIEVEAVFTLGPVAVRPVELVRRHLGLRRHRAHGPIRLRALHAVPGGNRLRRFEAAGRGIPDADERVGAVTDVALQLATRHLDDRRVQRVVWAIGRAGRTGHRHGHAHDSGAQGFGELPHGHVLPPGQPARARRDTPGHGAASIRADPGVAARLCYERCYGVASRTGAGTRARRPADPLTTAWQDAHGAGSTMCTPFTRGDPSRGRCRTERSPAHRRRNARTGHRARAWPARARHRPAAGRTRPT